MARCIESGMRPGELVSASAEHGGLTPADNVDEDGRCLNEAHPDLKICLRCAQFYSPEALTDWMSADPEA